MMLLAVTQYFDCDFSNLVSKPFCFKRGPVREISGLFCFTHFSSTLRKLLSCAVKETQGFLHECKIIDLIVKKSYCCNQLSTTKEAREATHNFLESGEEWISTYSQPRNYIITSKLLS